MTNLAFVASPSSGSSPSTAADSVIRRIFQMALQGKSTLDITKTLNGEGIPTSTGKHWLKSTVHRILSNEA